MFYPIKIRLQQQSFSIGDALELFVLMEDSHGKHYSPELTLTERKEIGQHIEPLLNLTQTQGQVLIDDLWQAGLRPTEGKGSAGSLAATQRHLSDMRSIVEAKLNIKFDKGTN